MLCDCDWDSAIVVVVGDRHDVCSAQLLWLVNAPKNRPRCETEESLLLRDIRVLCESTHDQSAFRKILLKCKLIVCVCVCVSCWTASLGYSSPLSLVKFCRFEIESDLLEFERGEQNSLLLALTHHIFELSCLWLSCIVGNVGSSFAKEGDCMK